MKETVMRQKTKLLTIALLVTMFIAGAGKARAETTVKIAVVDLYRVIDETNDGKKAKTMLESYFEKKQGSLDKKSEVLKVKMDDLKKKQKIMSGDDYQEEVDDLQAEIVELQNTYMKYQKLVAKREMDLTEPILAKIEKVLEKIGKEQGYTMILRKEAVAWIPEAKDITDQVIKVYNEQPPVDFKKVKSGEVKGSSKTGAKKDK
jgi:outer membrane protein